MQMKTIERKSESTKNYEISIKKVLDDITSNDDREELIYTIIDASYNFELISTIASFKYFSHKSCMYNVISSMLIKPFILI